MNLARVLSQSAGRYGEKTAVVFGDRTYSYYKIDRTAAKYAGCLERMGLKKGDRVAIQLPKCMEFLFVHLGNLTIGAVTVPLNPDYTPTEVKYFLADSGSSLLITDRKRFLRIGSAVGSIKGLQVALTDAEGPDGSLPLGERAEKADTRERRRYPAGNDDAAMICYTSGTTGRSKGAVITHGNLVSNMKALQEIWAWTDRDRLLHVLPLFHIHGLAVAMHGALHAGSTVFMNGKFDPRLTWQTIEKEKITLFMAVPTIYHRLMEVWSAMRPDLRSIRVFISGSAPLSETLFQRFEKATGFRILERYGMTEAQMIASNPLEPARRVPRSVGYPLPGVEIRLASSEGNTVRPGEIGEVRVKGENVFKGYWRMPEKTAEAVQEGWLRSGDLGYQDPEDDFRLYLVGRSKELIISGGLNVYPKEVESALERHDAVEEAAVFGLPDEDFGETVSAAVVLKQGVPPPDPEKLRAFARQYLSGYKCPRKIFFLDSLPKNAMGKVQKEELRKGFLSELGLEGS
jgi:malonyl-CoA/methylmalonyl-CoA synthetase